MSFKKKNTEASHVNLSNLLNEALCNAPPWVVEKRLEKHPANGFNEMIRFAQKTLKTLPVEFRSGLEKKPLIITSELIIESCKVITKQEAYGSSSTCIREYIELETKQGVTITISERAFWVETSYLGLKSCLKSIGQIGDDQYSFPTDMFEILQDHREYPIWSCRQSVMTFLLGKIISPQRYYYTNCKTGMGITS